MKIKVTSISPKGISIENGSGNQLEFLEVLEFERTRIADGLEDKNFIINLSDICVAQISIDSERDADFFVQADRPVIEMVFFISSGSDFHFDNYSNNYFSIEYNQHNIFYCSENGYRNSWAAGKDQQAITITLFPENIIKYLPEKRYAGFLKNIEKQNSTFLFEQNLVITPRMHLLLQDILESKHSEGLRRLHIENSVYELFFLQIEQYNSLTIKNEIGVGHFFENKIKEVKEFIDNHLAEPHSIKNLAHLVGMNDYHLKKGFKHLYKMTVYSYIIHKRMEHSKNLLLYENRNVNEVAFLMGYNDATNFTAAFKKHFGFTPGKIIRNR